MKLQEILKQIRKADNDFDLIQDGDVIAVGVSGGKDSMVLLAALHMYSKFKSKNFKVVGINIMMGFPDMDFSDVIQFCDEIGVPFYQEPSQVYEILKLNPDKKGRIQCSICSKFKKALVIDAAKKYGCNKVAFGHHSDDAVETLFMNMIHGGKIATFTPKMYLSRTDMNFIRPLIYCYEQDILNALELNEIPYVTSTCPNDKHTEREETKLLLQELYAKYPNARHNFVYMLSNQNQIELWEKEEDFTKES